MKIAAFGFIALLLFSVFAATTYTAEYIADNWLKVTRYVLVQDSSECISGGVSDVCANTGAIQTGGHFGVLTQVSLTAQNIGPIDRSAIEISESLSSIPSGAQLEFDPAPSIYDTSTAAWAIGDLSPGEAKSVSYSFSARMSEGAAQRIPDVSVKASPASLVLSTPDSATVGDKVQISLKSKQGIPIPNTVVYVNYPDGTSQAVTTDSAGVATLLAGKEGHYTYSVEGYLLSGVASTQASPEIEIPDIAATAADESIVSAIVGALPIFVAVFAVAVVALLVYGFFTSRKDEEEYEPEPEEPQQTSAPIYTQKFSFSEEKKKDEKVREATRGIIETRKKHMQEEKEPEPEKEPVQEPVPAKKPESYETTKAEEDMEKEIAKLEQEARDSGEVAEEEPDIEKTIAELEEIREKIKQRRQQAEIEEPAVFQEKPKKVKPKVRPRPVKPQKRAKPKKGKKTRFGSHGTKKKK